MPSPRSGGRETATPLSVLFAIGAWYLLAGVVLTAALGAEKIEGVSGVALGVATTTSLTSPTGVLGVLLGGALLLGCVLLGLGHAWALRAMVPLGAVAVLAFATSGSWLTLVLMAALVLGTAPLLSARALAYLGRGRAAGVEA